LFVGDCGRERRSGRLFFGVHRAWLGEVEGKEQHEWGIETRWIRGLQ
jgi:hypothetical protein